MMVYNTITRFGYLCICVIQLFSKKEGRITYASTRNQHLVAYCTVMTNNITKNLNLWIILEHNCSIS